MFPWTKSYVRARLDDGSFLAVKLGGILMIDLASVEEYVRKHSVPYQPSTRLQATKGAEDVA